MEFPCHALVDYGGKNRAFLSQKFPYPWRSGSPSNTCFPEPRGVNTPNDTSILSYICVEVTPHCPPICFSGPGNTLQNCPFPWAGSETPLKTWFLGHTWVHITNNTSSSSTIFCRTHSCDQQTHRQTHRHRPWYICNNRLQRCAVWCCAT